MKIHRIKVHGVHAIVPVNALYPADFAAAGSVQM
jgi:hypothetical protein